MFLIYDTETTGLPKNFNAPLSDSANWPRLVQLAWQLHDADGALIEVQNMIVRPDGFTIPYNSEKIHGISTERATTYGRPLKEVLDAFESSLAKAQVIAGHNIQFDLNIVGAEHHRLQTDSSLLGLHSVDTKDDATAFCQIPGGRGGGFKWPTLTELHQKLFGEGFDAAHNAAADVEATTRCFLELIRQGVIPAEKVQLNTDELKIFKEKNPAPIEAIGLNVQPYEAEEQEQKQEEVASISSLDPEGSADLGAAEGFAHWHVHSQFSVLQATCSIDQLAQRAADLGMKAVALTDFGNMYGAFAFVSAAEKAGIKPIIGYEAFVCSKHEDHKVKDDGRRIPLYAMNKKGYENLAKLSSIAFTEGFYYVPRIDKELLMQHSEGLIATSGGLSGEVPHLILNVGETQAEEAFCWWKEAFGENFYVEINRHGVEAEEVVNKTLISFCKKYDVPYFAAHETYYIEKEDAEAQDILLCVKDNAKKNDPIGRGRGFRFGMPNEEFYLKSREEMAALFSDLPEALTCTAQMVERIEAYPLKRPVLLPKFNIPESFEDPLDKEDEGKRGENAYLRHLAYEGAQERYGETLSKEVRDRLDFELGTIERTGYPGYFLIVQDFTGKAREMGVSVGPGRGSAAGSVVAYCTGITNVDPLKYGLLFERFLNPDRISLPDIDIDFDDIGRDKVIQYVIDTYGSDQVAHIITYGTMAAKSAIRDTARVLDIPIEEVNRLAKLMPDRVKLRQLLNGTDRELAELINNREQLNNAYELKRIAEVDKRWGSVLSTAMKIEGSLRNTGIHACGVIITPEQMNNLVPIMRPKEAMMMATQFDNDVVEDAGLLKMDFLGLKTLSIINTSCELIHRRHGISLDMETIPLDDPKTMALFAKGETTGLFQFESPGMQKNLRLLRPERFEDVIAMNALYRPGPMEYIPQFARRKNGEEEIQYDLPIMEEILSETYGITVYQEQVMMLSRKLAGFSRGQADQLRKAMGKKIKAQLDKLKPLFMEGAGKNGHPSDVLEKIWSDWEAFAKYAFNKSHSACYSVVAWQTAYLKANYPSEFMAALLTHNKSDLTKVTFFIEECRRMGLEVLGPDVNESLEGFAVNEKGAIRFGLAAMKGVGESACTSIVAEREENGPYSDFFEFLSRVDGRSTSRQTMEALICAGAFDQLMDGKRSLFFYEEDQKTFLEKSVRYAQSLREEKNSSQVSLFGESSSISLPEPQLPQVDEWPRMVKLKKEKEYLNIYLSSHPLDDYRREIDQFTSIDCRRYGEMMNAEGSEGWLPGNHSLAGFVSQVRHGVSKAGKEYGVLQIEDYSGSFELFLNGESYLKYRHLMESDRLLHLSLLAESWTKKLKESGREQLVKRGRVQQILMLEDVLKEKVERIQLLIELHQLDTSFIDRIIQAMDPFWNDKDGVSYEVRVQHSELELMLQDHHSRKLEIKHELLETLDALPVTYRLQSK